MDEEKERWVIELSGGKRLLLKSSNVVKLLSDGQLVVVSGLTRAT